MKRRLAPWLLMLCLAWLSEIAAASAPKVLAIRFAGNHTTRPSTMLRELTFGVGDAYDAERVEASRQAIQDLGLFRAVTVRAETLEEGVDLTFTVAEKWYLQAYPRLSANSDGQNSLGAELRWNNLWGLNHSLRLLGRSRDSRDTDKGRDLSYRASYIAPFLLGEQTGLSARVTHSVTPYTEPWIYDETLNEAELMITRAFGKAGSASQGWSLGLGPLWSDHRISGSAQARSYGTRYALASQLEYRDLHNRIYSDEGRRLTLRFELADQHLASDFSASLLTATWTQAMAIGTADHQTLEWGLSLGLSNNGLTDRPAFSLGGSSGLKGFDRRSFDGDRYYLAHLDFMRPLFWKSLRGALGLEIGNATFTGEALSGTPNISLNAGLRFRPRRLVDFEVELGIALPLNDGGSRVYAQKPGDL